jgi:hypothetical protein
MCVNANVIIKNELIRVFDVGVVRYLTKTEIIFFDLFDNKKTDCKKKKIS